MKRHNHLISFCASAIIMAISVPSLAGPPPGGYSPDELKYPNIVLPDVQFGTWGHANGDLNEPLGVAVSDSGQIYIADAFNNRIQVFSSSGQFLHSWGSTGSGSAQFRYPTGIALSVTGEIFVLDTGNHRIQVFTELGHYNREWGRKGNDSDALLDPRGIAVDDKFVYVSDTGNNRVKVFSHKGVLHSVIGRYGTDVGQLNAPIGIATDGNGHFFVSDSQNSRIQKFSSDGRHITQWGTYGSFAGQLATPMGLSYSQGKVFVADLVNHRIQIFSEAGEFSSQFGRHPPERHEGNGRMHYPVSVAVSPKGKVSAVCEPFENRCQVFSGERIAAATFLDDAAWWAKGPTRFHYGSGAAISGSFLAITEPETHALLLMDITGDIPLLITAVGGYGSEIGQFKTPSGVAVDEERGVVFVSDTYNHRVQVFEFVRNEEHRVTGLIPKESFGSFGAGVAQFNQPGKMTLDKAGNIFVLDVLNGRIQVFDARNRSVVSVLGGVQPDEILFNGPMNLAFSPSGDFLYVVDSYNYAMEIISKGHRPSPYPRVA